MPSKSQQTKDDLRRHLSECIGFLKASSAAFDAGSPGEAKRLAATIRLLLHDTSRSRSLLGQLGIKTTLRILDTSTKFEPRNLVAYHGLVGMQIGPGGASFWAPLDQGSPGRLNKRIPFADWWNKIVIVDNRKATFNRRELILEVANTDGGSHVDPDLNEDYALLSRGNTIGWMTSDGVNTRPMGNVELFTIRQIAYELLQTLERVGDRDT